jgi:serine/threonine-protein kinase
MNHQPCNELALEELLHDDCNVGQLRDLESHLEVCETCQTRLAKLAADENLWTQASSHLSTISEIELPERLTSRLNETTAFFVPSIAEDVSDSNHSLSSNANTDWTQILDPPTHPEMLGRIDGFEIESKIGHGGMGIVLKGFDRELNRAVAIKVLSPHLAINGTARKRFAREAESAAAVMHPNVVPIYSVNKSPTRPYIVMQLVPGHSLQSLVNEKGPLDPKDVVRVGLQVAAGLAAAHKQGLIHRDVKPGNILIEREVSRVMITDFGLARAADDAGMTQTGWLAGTPHYMSPEQSKGDDLDARTDLFSLGSLMYFVATGREPFRGDKPYAVIQKIISTQQTHPIEANADVPAALAQVIEKLLEKDPKHRFQSADQVVQVLEEYLAHLQQPTKTRAPKRILTARQKRRRGWLAGIGLAGVIVAATWMGAVALDSSTPNSAPKKVAKPNSSSTIDSPAPEALVPIVASSTEPSESTAESSDEPASEAIESAPAGLAAFDLSDDELSDGLSQAMRDLQSLEQSMRNSAPLELNVSPSTIWPPSISPSQPASEDTKRFESELRTLESNLEDQNQPFSQGNTFSQPINSRNQPSSKPSNKPKAENSARDTNSNQDSTPTFNKELQTPRKDNDE